jgi:leucyl aminopeptidase
MVIPSVRVSAVGDLTSVGAIGLPVARDDQGLLLAQGLPAELVGVSIPTTLDTTWAAEQGFEARPGQALAVRTIGGPTLLLLGIGDAAAADGDVWRRLGAAAVRASAKSSSVAILLPLPSTVATAEAARSVTEGALLASYKTGQAKSVPEEAPLVEVLVVPTAKEAISEADLGHVATGVDAGRVTADAVCWAREMINRPAAQLTPRRFAHEALRRLEDDPQVTVVVWRDAELEAERLGGLLGVAAGSLEPARLVVATYEPETPAKRHVVLVGKGITFDSGGLSLKTPEGMTTMKTDMTGAAVVLGTLGAVAKLNCAIKVTAIAPITENLPGHKAMKPGDVLTARNGTTIEVLNTDAEGRLVLADGLSLAAEMSPDAIIDVATLTGAVRTALGDGVGAVLGSDADLVAALRASGERQGEPLWELPLVDAYDSYIDSDIADIKNIGKAGQAGTIVAALFLRRFTAGVPWAHLDIAAVGRSDASEGYTVKGATAFSLRTLVDFLLTN